MGLFNRGAEREFGDDMRRAEKEQYETSWNKLQEIMNNFNGDPAQIPLEELDNYRSAAEHYVSLAENPNQKVDAKMEKLARQVIAEAESAEALK